MRLGGATRCRTTATQASVRDFIGPPREIAISPANCFQSLQILPYAPIRVYSAPQHPSVSMQMAQPAQPARLASLVSGVGAGGAVVGRGGPRGAAMCARARALRRSRPPLSARAPRPLRRPAGRELAASGAPRLVRVVAHPAQPRQRREAAASVAHRVQHVHAAALDVHGTMEPDLREVYGGGDGREGAGVVRGVGADVPRVRAGDARPAHGDARLLAGMYPGKLPGKLPGSVFGASAHHVVGASRRRPSGPRGLAPR